MSKSSLITLVCWSSSAVPPLHLLSLSPPPPLPPSHAHQPSPHPITFYPPVPPTRHLISTPMHTAWHPLSPSSRAHFRSRVLCPAARPRLHSCSGAAGATRQHTRTPPPHPLLCLRRASTSASGVACVQTQPVPCSTKRYTQPLMLQPHFSI